jgi:hypothetical protein
MAAFVGRLRACPVLDYKFVALGHNTVRGAAGAAVLNAEMMHSEVAFSLELRIVERASGEQVVVRLSNCRLSWGRGVMKKMEANDPKRNDSKHNDQTPGSWSAVPDAPRSFLLGPRLVERKWRAQSAHFQGCRPRRNRISR